MIPGEGGQSPKIESGPCGCGEEPTMTEATGGMDMGDDPPVEYGWEDALDEACTCHDGNPWTGECIPCGVMHCHFRDGLHCHHDGCPSDFNYEPPEVWHNAVEWQNVTGDWVRQGPGERETPAKPAQAAARECHAASVRAIAAGDFEAAVRYQDWRAYWCEVQAFRFPSPPPSHWMVDSTVSDVPF